MGFLIYKKTVSGANASYEQIQALKLGGRDGLIARHVKTLAEEEQTSWKIDSAALLGMTGVDTSADSTVILFDVAGRDSTSVCLYELRKIHGSCRDSSTQLALDFVVVMDQEIGDDAPAYAKRFDVSVPPQPQLLGETLSLSGGPGGGDWKWGSPPMQLGATIVQAHGGHGGGGTCANCTCGRAAGEQ